MWCEHYHRRGFVLQSGCQQFNIGFWQVEIIKLFLRETMWSVIVRNNVFFIFFIALKEDSSPLMSGRSWKTGTGISSQWGYYIGRCSDSRSGYLKGNSGFSCLFQLHQCPLQSSSSARWWRRGHQQHKSNSQWHALGIGIPHFKELYVPLVHWLTQILHTGPACHVRFPNYTDHTVSRFIKWWPSSCWQQECIYHRCSKAQQAYFYKLSYTWGHI